MSAPLHSRGALRASGFTLVEFIVVIAVLALIATFAAPSFTRMFAKKRVEGVASELVTDLQYARSEALHRNGKVRVTFGPGCYVIHTVGGGGTTCSASGSSSVDPSEIELKTVQLVGASTVSLSPNGGLVFLEFDAQRGSVDPAGSIDVISTAGEWKLRAVVNVIGRVNTCSPHASVAGYSSLQLKVSHMHRLNKTRVRQSGLSMVETMVGLTVGLFIVGGALKLFIDNIDSNRKLLIETRVNQDLRAASDLIARDLRRAGYWEQASSGVWQDAATPVTPNPRAAMTSTTSDIVYEYDKNGSEVYVAGFRLFGDKIQMRTATSTWQDVTDPSVMKVTYLSPPRPSLMSSTCSLTATSRRARRAARRVLQRSPSASSI